METRTTRLLCALGRKIETTDDMETRTTGLLCALGRKIETTGLNLQY